MGNLLAIVWFITLTHLQIIDETEKWPERAARVKDAFIHAYSNYRTQAFPHDELKPLSKGWNDKYVAALFSTTYSMSYLRRSFTGWGVSAFDSLDTMLLMSLDDEFADAISLVEHTAFQMEEVWTSCSQGCAGAESC